MGVRRPGSFPGNDPSSVLSPRSEAGALGVYMVENVLGGSPGMKPYVVSQVCWTIFISDFINSSFVDCSFYHCWCCRSDAVT